MTSSRILHDSMYAFPFRLQLADMEELLIACAIKNLIPDLFFLQGD